ncbi:MAG: sodium/proline symporter PutP [Eggerthellaceae bacterium]|nr:sodium/proline symporter PutP [Eggerthellaceae bacterium]
MVGNDFWVAVAMLLYFVVVVLVGFIYTKRSNSSTEEYFLGGRKLGPWLTALSAEASDMSGWLLMGLPGVAYFMGASDALWTAIGLAIGTYLNWKFIAARLRKYSEVANNSITLPDYFSNRFHDNKSILMTIAALLILVFFSIYAGSCFVTCGKLFSTLFGLDYATMMIIGAIIVFLYTFVGGYLAVCTTDLIQGSLMFVALVTIFVGSVVQAGGLENTIAFLSDIPGFLSATTIATPLLDESGKQIVENGMPLFGEANTYGVITIVSGLAWGLGYFGMPQVLIRFMSVRHSSDIKKSRLIAMIWLIVSLSAAVCIGLIGRAALPVEFLTQASAENVFIILSKMILPSFFCGLVVSGIFAAAMSSSSSYLLMSGSAVANNIYKGLFKRNATDAQVMIVARITLVAVLIFGCAISLDQNSSIFNIVSYAWAGLGASFGPLMILSLYWRRTTLQGAAAGMITGGLTVILWDKSISPLGGWFGVYELLPGFILSFIVIFVVSKLTAEPSQEIYDEFDHYNEADL